MATKMEETKEAGAAATNGSSEHQQQEQAQDPYADEHGRVRGVVLWYNVALQFGFIVPEDPGSQIVRVLKRDIKAASDSPDVQGLYSNQIVHYTKSDDAMSALGVTGTDEQPVDFSKKKDPRQAEQEARHFLLPHLPGMGVPPPLFGYPPHGFGPPPHGFGGPLQQPPAQKRKKQPRHLPVDPEKVVFGTVVTWHSREGWGHIRPDAPVPTEAGEASSSSSQTNGMKSEAGASDADGDHAMNGEGEGETASSSSTEKKQAPSKPKEKLAPIVAEIDQIETAPDRYPGLTAKLRVQFRVDKGPYPRTVTAIKVRQEDGSFIEYQSAYMKKFKKSEPLDDTIYKGKISWFGKDRTKPFGFIQPEGTEGRDDAVFMHIVETNFMQLELGTEVEYKLAEGKREKKQACCVTGPGGAALEYIRPKKRRRIAPPTPAHPQQGPPVGFGWASPPGFGGAWGPPLGFAPIDNAYAPPAGNPYAADAGYGYPPANPASNNRRKSNSKKRKNTDSGPKLSPEELTCNVCEKTMTGKQTFDSHMAGKAHKKKMKDVGLGGTIANPKVPSTMQPQTTGMDTSS